MGPHVVDRILVRRAGAWCGDRLLTAVSRVRPTTPVFVWGCHRSGTTMLLRLMKSSPWCTVYHENNERAMREDSRIRDEAVLRDLIRSEPRVFPVFKPLNDAQHASSQLAIHPRSRGLWIYREYGDVVNSMVVKWGASQTATYTAIASGNWDGGAYDPEVQRDARIFSEGMSEGTLSDIAGLVKPDMTPEEGGALHWYSRNRLYFELGLDRDPRVELVKYEDVVRDPDRFLRRAFDFVGCGYRSEWAASVFRTSVKKKDPPVLRDEYRDLCRTLLDRLDTEYRRRVVSESGRPGTVSPDGAAT
jgi:hypothetical protein